MLKLMFTNSLLTVNSQIRALQAILQIDEDENGEIKEGLEKLRYHRYKLKRRVVNE